MTDIVEPTLGDYALTDRYTRDEGTVFLSGVQALARVPLEQMRVDRRRGLQTAAFMSGYPGSPLAGIEREASVAVALGKGLPFVHQPALNEELAATAVMGAQLAAEQADSRHDGVIGFWYGKFPGVDRASDALRHGVFAGVHRNSGAVAYVGDDNTAKSSTLPSAADATLIALHMPVLAPGDVQESLDLGRHAIAMSRASGLWSAMRVVTQVADGTGTIELDLDRVQPIIPTAEYRGRLFVPRADGYLLTPHSVELEQELFEIRLSLAQRYGADNNLNEIVVSSAHDWIGLVASGHTYHELRQSLAVLGLRTNQQLSDAGIRLLQLRMPSPIDPQVIRRFAVGLDEIMVVEDKKPLLETVVAEALYPTNLRPRITGKFDGAGTRLLPIHGALDADSIGAPLRSRLIQRIAPERLATPASAEVDHRRRIPLTVSRTPYFCSGCPHNISTQTPAGSMVGAGIGCHTMVMMMDTDRVGSVVGITCMGNEGAQWVGMAPFVGTPHLIQNLGDGTYSHSGQLAVRWAISTGVNITYKILVNGVVAMTGGQDLQGAQDVPTMAKILMAEGVKRMVITTDDVDSYDSVTLPADVEVWDRTRIVEAQELLATIPGTTVLIHDQACAAENRRLRKRNQVASPPFRVVINERVCEGCGDCGQKSNCLSVQPVSTPFGRKTHIDQNTCNLDFSCITGDCPSFATVTPAKKRRRGRNAAPTASVRRAPKLPEQLPEPAVMPPRDELLVRMPGIGGTGVVTASQIVGTAAMLDGYSVRGLDQTGLSQKAGQVVSDVCISREDPARAGEALSNKAPAGEVDVLMAFDLLVAASDLHLSGLDPRRTVIVGSESATPTGAMVLHPDLDYPQLDDLRTRLDQHSRADLNRYAPVAEILDAMFGDASAANIFLLGVAVQIGALPLRSVERAIELNGVAVDRNIAAFRWGRAWAVDPTSVLAAAGITHDAAQPAPSVDPLAMRVEDLVGYQSQRYADRYVRTLDELRSLGASPAVMEAIAVSLHKLMAYKDEYEVARLLLAPEARAAAEAVGGPGARVQWKLHPPILRAMGMRNKMSIGRWGVPLLHALRAGRRLRGTALDVPGWTKLRRIERQLPGEYVDTMRSLIRAGHSDEVLLEVANLADMIRGYEGIKLANIAAYRSRLAQVLGRLGSKSAAAAG